MLAIYRKYRPRKLEDLLGHEAIVEVLKNAAKTDRLAHAYLFFGARGSGKTTTARLIAKIANCEARQKDEKFKQLGEPCNNCRVCNEIDSNQALDVIEIDAASNRGIDEIRELKEGIRLSPTSYKYKIFIIDEVHQLTKDAFNALLKTLEEPPAHAILILATTEYEKVPATISSRTQRFHFKKVSVNKIIEKLNSIVKTENIPHTAEGLELIAAAADGSFRDAESLLDQIANMEGTVSAENVERILGRVSFKRTFELADLVIKKELQKTLDYLNTVSEEGYNMIQFAKDLIAYFRKVLVLHYNPSFETQFKNTMTDTEFSFIKQHASAIDEKTTINLVKSLIRAYTEMRYSPIAIIPFEIALIENLRKD